MSFLAPLTDANSGAGYKAQGSPGDVLNPTTVAQANDQYNQANSALAGQAAFLNALQAQNGIGNQSNVFAQQQQLAQQLQQQAVGGGPNPAMDQLNQTTAANTANQAALMAGARGASQNPALIAELAARQGAANQQQAVGQAATLGAQQQLSAQQQLAGQQANMANLASQQVGQQANATQQQVVGTQNEQQNVLNGIAQQNNANVGLQSNINSVNGGIAQGNQAAQAGIMGGLMSGAGSALSAFGFAHGGMVGAPKMYAEGGPVQVTDGPQSMLGQFLQANGGPNQVQVSQGIQGNPYASQIQDTMKKASTSAMPGSSLSSVGGGGASAPTSVAGGGDTLSSLAPVAMMVASKGGPVPGKAAVKGDSYANDTQPAMLSPGEIVIPRHITTGKDAPKKAAAFVAAILAKQGKPA